LLSRVVVVGFVVADQQPVFTKKKGIVAPSCILNGLQHLWPHLLVPRNVLVDQVGVDLQLEANSHRISLPDRSNKVARTVRFDSF
jgi:hypothetical protein